MVSAAQASVTCRTPAGRAPAGPLPATCRPVHTEADGRPRPLGRCRVRSSASKLRCHVPLVQALPVLVPPPPPVLVPPPPCKCHQHCQRRAHRLCCHCCHITGTMGGGQAWGLGLSVTVGPRQMRDRLSAKTSGSLQSHPLLQTKLCGNCLSGSPGRGLLPSRQQSSRKPNPPSPDASKYQGWGAGQPQPGPASQQPPTPLLAATTHLGPTTVVADRRRVASHPKARKTSRSACVHPPSALALSSLQSCFANIPPLLFHHRYASKSPWE